MFIEIIQVVKKCLIFKSEHNKTYLITVSIHNDTVPN